MRWVSLIAGAVVRFGMFLFSKAVLVLAVVAISLSFSMASFVVPTLASAMWRASAWVFGPPAVAMATETQRLRQQNQALRRSNQAIAQRNSAFVDSNRELRRQNQGLRQQNQALQRSNLDAAQRNSTLAERNRDLSTRNHDLEQTSARQTQANQVLRTENQRLSADNRQIRGQLSDHRRVTASTARRIGQRAVRTTTRSIAAIPLESVPVLGITTIIATTAWEIRDTCDTLEDMAEIQRYLGQEPDSSFAARACDSVRLQSARVARYSEMTVSECRADAEAARDLVFELANQARDSLPDLVADENTFDSEIVQTANEEFTAINTICDCIADLLCNPDQLAQR